MGLTTDRSDPDLGYGVDTEPREQQKKYLVLSEAELAEGFVRPVRQAYRHVTCGSETVMSYRIAATYARDPNFYGATYCCACRMHLPVGEFLWIENGVTTDQKVGS